MKLVCRIAVGCLLVLVGFSEPRALAQEKFSLSMFHFNVQYAAGGLKGFPTGTDDRDVFDLNDAEVQDLIIVESFEPILDLFLAHPTWKVTLEMQAYMVEIMLERHPGILAKLTSLVESGQAELVSFHWSDQLFLAYPKLDMERSHELMEGVWEQAGLEPSEVVFCQEGQFGVGIGPFAATRDRSVLVMFRNQFKYQHLTEHDLASPLYELNGIDVLLGGRSFSTPEVEVDWSFFDDGELLATGGFNPYVGKDFTVDPQAMAEYEQELLEAEANGFRIATIGEFVDFAKAQGLEQRPLPPLLDGTWQPASTNSMHRWMGASGLLDFSYGGERDNLVLTGNVRARHWVLTAETLVARAEQQGWIESGEYDGRLYECWREALLAQVSDATGINPFVGEVEYGLSHAAAALDCAADVVSLLAPEVGGPYVMIDTATGEVSTADDLPSNLAEPEDAFFSEADGFQTSAPGRLVEATWEKVGLGDGLHRLTLQIGPPEDGQRVARVSFPLALDGFSLTHGLVENDAVFIPFSDFEFQEGRITLPVANGLIGLDDGIWLIKQTSTVHLGATFEIGSGEVVFEDQTLDPDVGTEWVFWILEGSEADALDLADRLNLHPTAWVETGVGRSRGCGCGTDTQDGRPGSWLILWFVFWGVRRSLRS